MERRGTMYDPLVVDTFIRTYDEIAPAALRAGQEAHSFPGEDPSSLAPDLTRPLRQIRANASEAAVLVKCRESIRRASSASSAIEIAAQCLRQLTPGTVYALYAFDSKSDSLICNTAIGDQQNALMGLSIPVGERVSGWTGANRQTSVNSDASLDLAQIARLFQPALRSTLSTPIANSEQLVAVLTGYACGENAFSDSHRDMFEQVALLLLPRLSAPQQTAAHNVVSFRIPRQQSGA